LELPIRGGVEIPAIQRNSIKMELNLSEEERAALTRHLCEHIRHTTHPFAESYELLKSILTKLDPESKILLNPEPKRR
jgi:predicted metal-binding transcription factor (methanogenesis marker protein 9)